tara:strand:+ start:4 stop:159 length:156 start_codon:yes stop_codon:yes gene_type:complete
MKKTNNLNIKEIEKKIIKLVKEDAEIPLISYEKTDLINAIKQIFKQYDKNK